MATGTTSLKIHAPTPRPARSMMLNALSTLSNAAVQASQPPLAKPSLAPGPPPTTRTTHLTPFEARQLLREKITAATSRRVNASKNPTTSPFSSPRRLRARRANPATAPRVPLSTTVALHNAERRLSLISSRERRFRDRPRPAADGKDIISKIPTLSENEVYCNFPPALAPPVPVLALHPMVRTKANRPLPRAPRRFMDENTVPFPTEAPALPASALPKARRTARAASCSLRRAPFAQISGQ
ncbi:hypothetical protein GSI_09520 [Ganoderma sinense ZZ0214-1]|uniref:Uncharacterized protein n=1 Tax=Ganoderma sinense ZZ0214-1 TaxID=1077348 RepID=A0A2G8S3L9_9APHY|nr:hypothetical protein GSI_09520 [Ganoderma sinense ZZ0214-1]